jgi:carbamoylphosphate synthase small subunit
MREHGVPGICGIDTRELTKKIREKGTILGRIVMGVPSSPSTEFQDPNKHNLVSEVSVKVQAVFVCGCDISTGVLVSTFFHYVDIYKMTHSKSVTHLDTVKTKHVLHFTVCRLKPLIVCFISVILSTMWSNYNFVFIKFVVLLAHL